MLSSLQSGFIPGDSTVNQLTNLYHTFCEALDAGKEVRAVSVTSAKHSIVSGTQDLFTNLELLVLQEHYWFRNYLSDRRQRVVLPGGSSE